MKDRIILAKALYVILIACDDDRSVDAIPEETSLVMLTVDASYSSDITANWIIVHAEDGSVLASKDFQKNQELEILTHKPVPGNLIVTHLMCILSMVPNSILQPLI
jgi:hypothetical protein